MPDTTTKLPAQREIQTTLDWGCTGRMSFTPHQASKAKSFQSRILDNKITKIEDLIEDESDDAVVINNSDDGEDRRGGSGVKPDKRRHPVSPEVVEEDEDDSISYCSDIVKIVSDHQTESDCPTIPRCVKQEHPMDVGNGKSNVYDPDIQYEDDGDESEKE